jgi:predicted kinase
MRANDATLFLFCGKMAAGKSTLARAIAAREHAVLLEQDAFVIALFPGMITDVVTYVEHAGRLTKALTPHIRALLTIGVSVVLDFPGNTRSQRAWFRTLLDGTGAAHELHVIEASDDLCKRQLRERSKHLPPGTPWTTDADFELITAYFQPPSDGEGFTIVRHTRE